MSTKKKTKGDPTPKQRVKMAKSHPLWSDFESYCYQLQNGYDSITNGPPKTWLPIWEAFIQGAFVGRLLTIDLVDESVETVRNRNWKEW